SMYTRALHDALPIYITIQIWSAGRLRAERQNTEEKREKKRETAGETFHDDERIARTMKLSIKCQEPFLENGCDALKLNQSFHLLDRKSTRLNSSHVK